MGVGITDLSMLAVNEEVDVDRFETSSSHY
jgi:hypothetical protein